ncbi:MAG: hypothetical protein RR902_06655 [Oscillospiraceae bacterium]
MNVENILLLMKNKIALFEIFKNTTNEMLSCDSDVLPSLIKKRQELIEKIDVIQDEIKYICDGTANGIKIKEAMDNTCDFADVENDLLPVFTAGQDLFAVINTTKRLDEQLHFRLSQEIDTLDKKIREINTGNSAKASMYFENMGIKTESHTQLGNA